MLFKYAALEILSQAGSDQQTLVLVFNFKHVCSHGTFSKLLSVQIRITLKCISCTCTSTLK